MIVMNIAIEDLIIFNNILIIFIIILVIKDFITPLDNII